MSRSGYDPYYRFPAPEPTAPPDHPPPAYTTYDTHYVSYPAPRSTVLPHEADSSDDEEHVQEDGELHKHCEKARKELLKYGIPATHHAQICIALDVSKSMEEKNQFYSSGKIQQLITKAMAMAMELGSGDSHTVTIFPFGKTAYAPIVIEEHAVKKAVVTILQAINHDYSVNTNYNAVLEKIRQHYFKGSGQLAQPLAHDIAPVFCFFVTDGEPNMQQDLARNQFRFAEYNAIFFKLIGLSGCATKLDFAALKLICKNDRNTFLQNRHLLELRDPSELTIEKLFENYRLWLIEAYEHKVLVHNPNIQFDRTKLHDKKEIDRLEALEAEHGHEDDDEDHGHVKSGARLQYAANPYASFNRPAVIASRQQGAFLLIDESNDECPACCCTIL